MSYLKRQNIYKTLFSLLFSSCCLFVLAACDRQTEPVENNKTVSVIAEVKAPVHRHKSQGNKIIIANNSYLFDVSDHSREEFQALLTRAETVSQIQSPDYDNPKIVMVIHGSDIDWFTQQNYDHNRQLIGLAARLDTYDIIDMKVCEKTMSVKGVERKDIPSFIETVPYVPKEIENRLQEGFINL